MFGKSKLGDSVATEMDRILGDAEFQSVFSTPELTDEYTTALSQDDSYKAFVRVASKKEDVVESVGTEDNKALALQYIVESLSKTSEALDNMGFDKSATVTLALINGIFKEAGAKFADDGMEGRVAELDEAISTGDIIVEEPEGEPDQQMPLEPEPPQAPEMPEFPEEPVEDPEAEPLSGPLGGLLADDGEEDGDKCMTSMAADKSDKDKDKEKAKKTCAADVKKILKSNGCKGTVKVTDKGLEILCKGEKAKCDACCKEIKESCKKSKVTCKIEKEYTDKKPEKKPEKKSYIITNKKILESMKEIDQWLKEA
jgi:acylphosphatase